MKFGEVVAIGKPFVCLDPERDSFEHCNFCLASCFELVARVDETSDSSKNIRMFMPVACTHCSTVLYCSEKCRADAWTAFHQFECSQMAILRQLDGPSHLALRSLYTFGGIRQLEEASRKCNSPVNPVEVMANQCNPSLIYSMPTSKMNTYEGDLAMILTAFFLFKLVQMGHLVCLRIFVAFVETMLISLILFLGRPGECQRRMVHLSSPSFASTESG